MSEPVSIAQLKANLRLGSKSHPEDELLERLLVSARATIEDYTDHVIAGAEPTLLPDKMPIAAQAILLLAGHWYDRRDGGDEIPNGVISLVRPLRRYR